MKANKLAAALAICLTAAIFSPGMARAADKAPTVVTYDNALKRACSSQQSIKDSQRTLTGVKQELSDAQRAYNQAKSDFAPDEELIELERAVLVLTNQRDSLEMDIESIKVNKEVAFRNSLTKIAEQELDMWLLEETIALNEQDLDRQAQLLQYGMTSQNAYDSAEQTLRQNRVNLEMMQITLRNERQALNQLLNRPLDEDIRIEYEVDMKPRVSNLTNHVITKSRNDQTYKRVDLDVQLTRFDYANQYGGSNEYTREIQFKQAERSRDDAHKKVQATIRTSDKNLEQLLKTRESLELDLQKAEDDYQVLLVRMNAGLATQYDADSLMLNIYSKQAALTKNQYQYWKARFTFDYPFLNS